ncbi:hypothetical protein MTO96_039953 [Rhipicephalus appendiculatus]
MDRLETKRAARRAQSTRVINEATTLLQSDCNDRAMISKVIDKLVASRDELRKINAELEDVIPVEELETEYESAAHYDDQTIETLTRLQCRLEDLSIAFRQYIVSGPAEVVLEKAAMNGPEYYMPVMSECGIYATM